MSDKLKQFIDDNREDFDSGEPGPQLFQNIHSQLSGGLKKKAIKWRPLRWAAVVAGLLLVSATAYYVLPKKGNTEVSTVKEPVINTEETNGSGDAIYAKEIYHFQELIGLKQAELRQLKNEYPDLYRQFVTDMNELDSSYQTLKIKLAENPNRELLLEAMIQNLQLQSELLNRQLMIIKQIKQKNKINEKNTI